MSLRVNFLLCGQVVAVEDIKWVDVLMVSRVVFAGIVGSIGNTFPPKIFELAMCVAAF
jgi:hypothetical protein